MRLRHGPFAGRLTEWVVLRAPDYAVRSLARRPEGVLAGIFVDLIATLDARPFVSPCRGCGERVDAVCAYAALLDLVPLCDTCLRAPSWAPLRQARRIIDLEDALRHVAETCPRPHPSSQRLIVSRLALAKGGPLRATEPALMAFFHGSRARPPPWPGRPAGATPPVVTVRDGQERR